MKRLATALIVSACLASCNVPQSPQPDAQSRMLFGNIQDTTQHATPRVPSSQSLTRTVRDALPASKDITTYLSIIDTTNGYHEQFLSPDARYVLGVAQGIPYPYNLFFGMPRRKELLVQYQDLREDSIDTRTCDIDATFDHAYCGTISYFFLDPAARPRGASYGLPVVVLGK